MRRLPSSKSSQVYLRLLGFLRPYTHYVALAFLASAIAAACGALFAYLLGPLLESTLTRKPVDLFGEEVAPGELIRLVPALLIGVASLKAVSAWLQGGWMQQAAQRVMRDVRRFLYERLLAQPPAFYERRHSGELLSRLTADVAQTEFAVSQSLTTYVKDGLQVIALLIACAAIDLRLFALAFVVLPAAGIPVSRFARGAKRAATRTQSSVGRLTELTAEQLHNLPVVQAFNAQALTQRRFEEEQHTYLAAMKRSLFVRGAFTPTLELLGMVGVSVALFYGARAVAAEPDLAGKLLSFLAAALLLYQPLKAISGTHALVMHGLGSAQRLFELTDEAAPDDRGVEAPPLTRALELDAVTVSYDAGRSAALEGVSLTIPAGRKVALVGPSGAGKTTLFALLLRFVSPASGGLSWDGIDFASLSTASVRARIGWVPQEPILFSGTVRDNLLLANADAKDAELWEALRRAHASAFVEARGGLDAQVGERGLLLSGGQRQRIAIARAFLKAPSLLLLDEPTSALDSASEAEVQVGLAELMKGRTTLVIAHRLSTVRDADVIYVLERGRVVERGSHDALSQSGGRYAQLLRAGEVAA